MEKVQPLNSRAVARTPRTSKMGSFATIFNGFVSYCFEALHLCGDPGYTSGNSAKFNKVQQKKLQHAKSATGIECKTKTLQPVKVQHEIEQCIKRVQHEKKCNMKRLLYKKVQHKKSATSKKCNIKNYHNEIRKKCTRIVSYSAQTDSGPSVDVPLCTDINLSAVRISGLMFACCLSQ